MKLPIHYVDEVDSTLSYAAREIKSKSREAPFALYCDRQTGGRGRKGQTWTSPSGNIYLTIALGEAELRGFSPSLIPLKVVTLISWWLAVEFNIRVTVKWPNDIYFAGRKLGGILCEGSSRNGEMLSCLVGIGLNLNVVPEISSEQKYDAVSLETIFATTFERHSKIQSLVRFFQSHWATQSDLDTVSDFEQFSIEKGQLFSDAKQQLLKFDGIDQSGMATFTDFQGASQKLVNPDESLTWIYSNRMSFGIPLLVVDVGNTAIKFAIFDDSRQTEPVISIRAHDEESIKLALNKLVNILKQSYDVSSRCPLHFSSVNIENLELFHSLAEGLFELIEIPHRPLLYRGQYDAMQMGIDRLALIESTLSISGENEPCVMVSCGTVTVVDFIDPSGLHLGGWLIPGVQTAASSLSQYTAQLPQIDVMQNGGSDKLAAIGGQNTVAAIVAGSRHMLSAMLYHARSQLARYCNVRPAAVKTILTGGYADAIPPEQDHVLRVPHLLINGLRLMVIGGQVGKTESTS
jgi:biotin-[acetyl-CoA-carboxylase] ligase BirA-like protein